MKPEERTCPAAGRLLVVLQMTLFQNLCLFFKPECGWYRRRYHPLMLSQVSFRIRRIHTFVLLLPEFYIALH